MLHTRATLLASAAVFAILACSAPAAETKAAPDNSADIAALKAMQDREFAALQGGNLDTMVSLYTSDVMMMAPGMPAVSGSDALRKFLEAFLKESSVTGKYTSADVQVVGDVGIVHYTGEMTATPKKGGKPATEIIKGLHIYKRQADGSWKIAQDVWNTDAPEAPAK
jgi:uncharacterized protein (TIGR02246 family)